MVVEASSLVAVSVTTIGLIFSAGVLLLCMLRIAVIDWCHQVIEDRVMIAALLAGIVVQALRGRLPESLVGALVAFGAAVLLRAVYRRIRGYHGMGSGDPAAFSLCGLLVPAGQWSVLLVATGGLGLLIAGTGSRLSGLVRNQRQGEPSRIPLASVLMVAMILVLAMGLSGCVSSPFRPGQAEGVSNPTEPAGLNAYTELRNRGETGRSESPSIAAVSAMPGPSSAPAPVPGLAPVLAAPEPPDPSDLRRVSLDFPQPVSLRAVLAELTRSVGVDLQMHPELDRSIIVTVRDRPFPDVIAEIGRVAGVRMDLEENRLIVLPDLPYARIYYLDRLNMARQASSTVTSSTSVFSGVTGANSAVGSARSNASVSEIRNRSMADPWAEIETAIAAILAVPASYDGGQADNASAGPDIRSPRRSLRRTDDPDRSFHPAEDGVALRDDHQGGGIVVPGTVEPIPSGDLSPAAAMATGGRETRSPYFTMNRQAGLITVFAHQAQQEEVTTYLQQARRAMGLQVLIEAKVLEVGLAEAYRAGIDWALVEESQALGASLSGFGAAAEAGLDAGSVSPALVLSFDSLTRPLSFNMAVNLVQRFGTVRTLSSPRMTVLNNQTAVFRAAENEVYFTFRTERLRDSDSENDNDDPDVVTNPVLEFSRRNRGELVTVAEVNTVPIGLLMSVQPAVNPETRRITLSIRPTLSRIARRVSDPSVQLAGGITQSLVPVVEVREMDSVVTVDNGQVVIMGGLMQERVSRARRGIPGLQDLPGIGALFRTDAEEVEVVELVIFLRATVIDPGPVRDGSGPAGGIGGGVTPEDQRLYHRFGSDPRPLVL